jgi:hypothetical protein
MENFKVKIGKMRNKITRSLFLLAAISLTFACNIPVPSRTVSTPPSGLADASAPAALLEPRLLMLDWPKVIRLGDVATIRLTLTIDTDGGLTVIVPLADIYTGYTVIAEAELELPRLHVRPPGVVSQPLLPGQNITFSWSVRPEEAGKYSGTVWFTLRFLPIGQVTRPEGELPVAALPVEFEVVSLAGLTGGSARLLGIIGIFLGLFLALPFLVDCLGWVRKEHRK